MSADTSMRKRRLLAVDDNLDSAELVGRIAARCGWEARSATKPSEVRRIVAEWSPDILTLDLCMPEGDGIDLMPMLTEASFAGRVIIISGHDEWLRRSARKLAAARGIEVIGDMQKPVNPQALRQMLAQLGPDGSGARP